MAGDEMQRTHKVHVHNLALQDKLVLAIPQDTAQTLTFYSGFSGAKTVIRRPSLFVCSSPDITRWNQRGWILQSMNLSCLIEIVAIVDAALGKAMLHDGKKEPVSPEIWQESISLSRYSVGNMSFGNIVVDLVLRKNAAFSTWNQMFRKFEAYGMMRFLLSAGEHDDTNLNKMSLRYGISAPYFRQLYRASFKITAKKKMMNVRMATAILQLIESECSVLEVGLEAGYCSASHFTNDIKKELGMTPSDIRRLETVLYEI